VVTRSPAHAPSPAAGGRAGRRQTQHHQSDARPRTHRLSRGGGRQQPRRRRTCRSPRRMDARTRETPSVRSSVERAAPRAHGRAQRPCRVRRRTPSPPDTSATPPPPPPPARQPQRRHLAPWPLLTALPPPPPPPPCHHYRSRCWMLAGARRPLPTTRNRPTLGGRHHRHHHTVAVSQGWGPRTLRSRRCRLHFQRRCTARMSRWPWPPPAARQAWPGWVRVRGPGIDY
jgi:hypothetical protein